MTHSLSICFRVVKVYATFQCQGFPHSIAVPSPPKNEFSLICFKVEKEKMQLRESCYECLLKAGIRRNEG